MTCEVIDNLHRALMDAVNTLLIENAILKNSKRFQDAVRAEQLPPDEENMILKGRIHVLQSELARYKNLLLHSSQYRNGG